jgi:hypothetical protein
MDSGKFENEINSMAYMNMSVLYYILYIYIIYYILYIYILISLPSLPSTGTGQNSGYAAVALFETYFTQAAERRFSRSGFSSNASGWILWSRFHGSS